MTPFNAQEIAEEIAKYCETEYPWDRTCEDIKAILDRHLEGKVLMPKRLLYHMRDLALGRDPKCAEIRAMIAEAEKS